MPTVCVCVCVCVCVRVWVQGLHADHVVDTPEHFAADRCAAVGIYVNGRQHEHSATGTRTRVARVRAEYPNQLDYSGSDRLRFTGNHVVLFTSKLLKAPYRSLGLFIAL